jgi:hypothetical protein
MESLGLEGGKGETGADWVCFLCSPDVEFCGYSIPHPSEAKLNLRIQTYGMYLRGCRPFVVIFE